MKKYNLAILTSHPIQYQTPLFKKIAEHPEIDLTACFCWDFGVKASYDKEFGREIKWDTPLLEGYKYKFLKNFSLKPSSDFWGQINPEIIREIIKNRYDAILIFGWNSFSNWLAFATAFVIGTPILLRGENPLNQELLKDKWKIKIKKIILGGLFRRIGAFLYMGEENKGFYQYYGAPEEKLFFCPYAVDNERFIKESEKQAVGRESFRRELNIDKNQIVILFLGKLIEKKRPFDLLKAYHRLATENQQSGDKAVLVFVGAGNLRAPLEKYTKDNNLKNVHFVGFKNQTEVSKYYALADIFVLPSGMGETWGLVTNEAMCFGLPVVLSDLVGCARNLAKQGENGYTYPLGDTGRLADCLKNLINDNKRKSFKKKSLKIIYNYSYEKNVNSILRALIYIKK